MKLSDRLEVAANLIDPESDEAEMLREASALAKRYEDAPVASVGQRSGGGPLVVSFLMDGKAEAGQRVRIVLDKEG